jgi:hypothetical protein
LLLDWQVGLSEQLVEFLWQNLSAYDRRQLVNAQKLTIGRVPLKGQSIRRLRRELSKRDFFDQAFWLERPKRPRAF